MPIANDVASIASSNCDEQTYYDHVDIREYDETIATHPYMDQIKAAIVAELVGLDPTGNRTLSILDAGTGSGQLARSILGAGFKTLELADNDRQAMAFCKAHPELSQLPFHSVDLAGDNLGSLEGMRYDAVCVLGVIHHIPRDRRTAFLRNLARMTDRIILGDEGIQEYSSEAQRKQYARKWYGFVISEAQRRGLNKLAHLEEKFMRSDLSDARGPEDDFKESPSAVLEHAHGAGLKLICERRLGNWQLWFGGMYVSLYSTVS